MKAVDPVIPLPPPLRIKAGPGETVYSFAARLERHLHATEGAIRTVAYLAAARCISRRANTTETKAEMIEACQTMCAVTPATLTAPGGNQPTAAYLCAECVGEPGIEYEWTGGRYTCATHRRFIGPGPASKKPAWFAPHPPGPLAFELLDQGIVDADLRIARLGAEGRTTSRLIDEVLRRIESALGQEHAGLARPEHLPAVAAVLTAITDPRVQAAVLDENTTFAERYLRLSEALVAFSPQSTAQLCDQIWLLLRPTMAWVRVNLLGEAPVDPFEPALIPVASPGNLAVRRPLQPFRRTMDCLQTRRSGDQWWDDRYLVESGSHRAHPLLICDDGHVQRNIRGHATQAKKGDFRCGICSGKRTVAGINSLGDELPFLAAEWDQEANDPLTPYMVAPASNLKVAWICSRGHHYTAYIANRTLQGTGCPVCFPRRGVHSGFNDLATTHPLLADLWDYEANGDLTPTDVSAGDARNKYCFRCPNGHQFVRSPAALVQSGGRCQTCVGHILIPGKNDLATIRPEIAAHWHPTKNGSLTPDMVKPWSNLEVWWLCDKGHEFPERIYLRCRYPNLCRVETGRWFVQGVNDVATMEPVLVKDWNTALNGIGPADTVRGNNKWAWTCRFGHTQQTTVATRRKSGGCTECAPADRVSSR